MSSSKARVKPFGAEQFVPQVPRGGAVLGVIERRMQVGALVRLIDGGYIQLNGDVAQPLNASMVERSLRAVRPVGGRQKERSAPPQQHTRAAAVVTVRRRRAYARPAEPAEV